LLKTHDRTAGIIKVLSMYRWKRAKGDIVPGTMKLELHCDPNDFEHLPYCIVIMHDLRWKN
jgi:hypothetical protein